MTPLAAKKQRAEIHIHIAINHLEHALIVFSKRSAEFRDLIWAHRILNGYWRPVRRGSKYELLRTRTPFRKDDALCPFDVTPEQLKQIMNDEKIQGLTK